MGAAGAQEATVLAATGRSGLVAGKPVHPLHVGIGWGLEGPGSVQLWTREQALQKPGLFSQQWQARVM